MESSVALRWLPAQADWRERVRSFRDNGFDLGEATRLANCRLDFTQTNLLDRVVQATTSRPPAGLRTKPVRLAVLGSSTFGAVHAPIRIAGLRRGLWVETYENDFQQYRQELDDVTSALHAFAPTAVLFAFDPWHLTGALHAGMSRDEADDALSLARQTIADCWRAAKQAFGCAVLQQTILPAPHPLAGSNEHRLAGSPAWMVARLNADLRDMADEAGVALVALDDRVARDGLGAWHDPALWLHAKQEIAAAALPFYGELVARVLAAQQGRSSKCLVLDLDNTIWGGVVGDDGVEGLTLGQGSATGEAFVAVQRYAKELSRRGVILAVCSKNDEANALEAFERHPEMVLKTDDISAFVANWNDKATNLEAIAGELNIDVDSLVFLDDNPFERNLVRERLPAVRVPELPGDPAHYIEILADAGYFESIAVTEDDRNRTRQYSANRSRRAMEASAGSLDDYLRGLDMRLVWRRFDLANLTRIAQLINKTNQFNLTTRRYGEDDVRRIMDDESRVGLQFRLLDRFGDNGIIAIVIGNGGESRLVLDTWLMSCRVLGRQVEAATLQVVAQHARAMGAGSLVGDYKATAKNGMVREHYPRLGFSPTGTGGEGGARYELDLVRWSPPETFISISEG